VVAYPRPVEVRIVERQPNGELAAVVPHGEVTLFGDVGDSPAVTVFHPVGCGESESAVVGAGDDHISDTGLVPISQAHFPSHRDVAAAMVTGSAVELSDKLAGEEHDRI
jgi:hypothetical protein